METDIERLHDVLEGKRTGRGCGRTTAVCHLILGDLEVGESPTVRVLLSSFQDSYDFARTFKEIVYSAMLRPRQLDRHIIRFNEPIWKDVVLFSADDTTLDSGLFPMWDARNEALPQQIDYEYFIQTNIRMREAWKYE